eukprot:jgi/Botrbrau1/23282/Bobra.0102s0025.1
MVAPCSGTEFSVEVGREEARRDRMGGAVCCSAPLPPQPSARSPSGFCFRPPSPSSPPSSSCLMTATTSLTRWSTTTTIIMGATLRIRTSQRAPPGYPRRGSRRSRRGGFCSTARDRSGDCPLITAGAPRQSTSSRNAPARLGSCWRSPPCSPSPPGYRSPGRRPQAPPLSRTGSSSACMLCSEPCSSGL